MFQKNSLSGGKKPKLKSKKSLLTLFLVALIIMLGLALFWVDLEFFNQSTNLQGCVFCNEETGVSEPPKPTGVVETKRFSELLLQWTNFTLPYITIGAVIVLIYGGILFVSAAGNEDKLTKGKTIIIWTVIGLLLVLSSYAIVNTLVNFQD